MEDYLPVVIIGGGLAGLTAAYYLASNGIPPIILDADTTWTGGRLCGGEPDEFLYQDETWSFQPDHGVHAVWGGYINMRVLLERLQITLQPSNGEEWINRWGREVRVIEAGNAIRNSLIPAPFHYLQLLFRPRFWQTITPLDFLSLPGFLFSLFTATGFDPIREKSALDGLMMREFFRGWTPNLRTTFIGLGVNLLAASKDQISLTGFIAAIRFYTILRRDSWQMAFFKGDTHTSLIEPMVNAVEEVGGKLLRGNTAIRLERQSAGWRVVAEDSISGGLRSFNAKHVILAANAPSAERLLKQNESTRLESEGIIFPSALRNTAIRLWFDKSPRNGSTSGMLTGDFLPNNFFWLHRLFDEFKIWHEKTGGSAIEVHIYGPDSVLDLPDRNLLIESVTEVQRAFPELKDHFVYGVVRRNSRTQTKFRVPTHKSLNVKTPWDELYACGDWIGYDSPAFWMERAVITGIAAANAVLQNSSMPEIPIFHPKPPEIVARIMGGLARIVRFIFYPIVIGGRMLRR